MEITIPRPFSRPPTARPSSACARIAAFHHFLLFSAALSALLFFSNLLSLPHPENRISRRFSIIIDAGSSGTRLHVFRFSPSVNNGSSNPFLPFTVESLALKRISPGLSAYVDDSLGAGGGLEELLEFGRRVVPREEWGDTEIRLMATAGMRLLEESARERILDQCRRALGSSGFRLRDEWASIIPGSDEGIYAWVTANYALGTLGGDPQETIGIVELGGASAQITFIPSEFSPPEFLHVLSFGKYTYNLYSYSFLHFGQNTAQKSLLELLSSRTMELSSEPSQEGKFVDPCSPKGYLPALDPMERSVGLLNSTMEHPVAHGNFSKCRSAALMLLQKEKDKCLYQECRLGSSFMPALQGKFLGTENFFYTTQFFGLGTTPYLSDIMLAGEEFCGQDWSQLERKYRNSTKEILSGYCFSSAYIVALLHDSLGFPLDERRIDFLGHVADVPLSWPLGASIMNNIANPSAAAQPGWINHNFTMLLCLLIVGFLVLVVFLALRLRKPRTKTIYDLEKGRYIVMRATL